MKFPRLIVTLFIAFLSLGTVTGSLASTSKVSAGDAAGLSNLSITLNPKPDTSEENTSTLTGGTDTLWVVRAFFTDRQMVNDLAAWLEPWEVHYDRGYLVVGVYQYQYELLENAGFHLEIDQSLTELYNRPHTYLPGQINGIPGYQCYRTVEETYATAQDLVLTYPNLADWIDIGDSWEKTEPGGDAGYDLMVLRLTNKNRTDPKPKLFVMSSIHAREYTPAELNTRFGEYLVTNYGTDPDATWLLDYHEIHLLLQSNPDGRKHAETGIYWRKNTNENFCSPTSNNRGADLNRNFVFQWGCCGGSSASECDELYRGPSPASEPETQAIQAYVRSLFPDQREDSLTSTVPITGTGIFIDLHSYGELVLWPWGFTHQAAPNGTALQTLGRRFAYFNKYSPEQAIGLYPTDGTTDDFAYGDLGLAAYTFELGTSFFQSCNTFENTILPHNLPALVYAAKAVRTPYMTPAGPDVLLLTGSPSKVVPGDSIQLTATIDDTRLNNSNGVESTQNISAAEYYIDVPPWVTTTVPVAYPMTATDGGWDGKVESVSATIDTTSLSLGRHIVFVRGQDADGNWGPISAIFVRILDPAIVPTVQGLVRQAGSNVPLEALVSVGDYQTTSNPATGFYTMKVSSGTYDLSASALGYAPVTIQDVTMQDYQTIQQDFYLSPICTVFSDDVEIGNHSWTADAPWVITDELYHSPSHSWTDSPGGDYDHLRDVALTSPPLNLTGFTGAMLNFWHTYDLEDGEDFGLVEYSIDGGNNWSLARTFSGTDTFWSQESIPIPALDDQSPVYIRFRLLTNANNTQDGWHIDDIVVAGGSTACLGNQPPLANFTANSPVIPTQTVFFTNRTTGTLPLTYSWDFGDGVGTSTDEFPTYIYVSTGIYTATLTAVNPFGHDSIAYPIHVQPCIPISNVAMTQDTNSGEQEDQDTHFLLDISPNDASKPYNYIIDYGDGTPITSSASNADPLKLSHTYATPGYYNAVYTAWNCDMITPITGSLLVKANMLHGLSLTSTSDAHYGSAGKSVTYSMKITNIGNFTDTFDVTIDSLWETIIQTPTADSPVGISLTLGAGEEESMIVVVTISPQGIAGDSDIAHVIVKSQGDPSKSIGISLTTTVAPHNLFMEWIIRKL